MEWEKRYRREGELPCIDLRVRRVDQLFDHRDPAPFIERDLDDDAADYLRAGVEELPARQPFKIVVWVEEPLPADVRPDAVRESVQRHFGAARERLRRQNKRARSRGRWMLLIAFMLLIVLLVAAQITRDLHITGFSLIPESLTVLAWVIIWRPLESLIFDWFPYVAERRMLDRIRRAPLEVRVGAQART